MRHARLVRAPVRCEREGESDEKHSGRDRLRPENDRVSEYCGTENIDDRCQRISVGQRQ